MSNFESEGQGAPAPGTGETPASADPGTSAGTQNTEGQGGTAPETVPYSRFKEVNDQMREHEQRLQGYSELEQYGYDPDSLGRLAAFEGRYVQDPTGVLTELVTNLADLPDETKDSITELLQASGGSGAVPAGQATNEGSAAPDEPPAWAKPLIEDHQARQAQSETDARGKVLDEVLNAWSEMDKKDGLETPEATKLAYITVNTGRAQNPKQLAEIARQDAMGYRDHVLGGTRTALRGNLASGSPSPVPGGGTPLPAPPKTPKTLEEATRMARAAMEQGTLPPVQAAGGGQE